MSVQIIINGETAAESLKELSTLAAGFGSPVVAPEVKQEEQPKRQTRQKADTPKQPVKEEQTETVQNEQDVSGDDDVPIPSDVELRALASEKAKSAGRENVKALLDKYKVLNVTAVPDGKRIAFLKELEAL